MSRTIRRATLLAVVLCLVGAASAQAALIRFATPSRNIGCIAETGKFIRCDISQSAGTRPPRPRSCQLDWGNAFGVERRSARGHGICAGDTALPGPRERIRIAAYGTTVRVGNGLRCLSQTTGLTCRNLAGHGFFLSKQRIRVF